MAKRFFYVSLGILCLAAAYHLGAASSQATGRGGMFVDLEHTEGSNYMYALTDEGDVWRINDYGGFLEPRFLGNIVDGPVPLQQESWAKIKSRYRE